MALTAKRALLAILGPISEEEAPLVTILDRVREDSALLLTTYTNREAVLAALLFFVELVTQWSSDPTEINSTAMRHVVKR